MQQQDIRNLSLSELQAYLEEHGHKPFRAKQIFTWVYRQGVCNFNSMTNLPGALRQLLAQDFSLNDAQQAEQYVSRDGTKKYLITLADGAQIETALIPTSKRMTLCVSSQVGCKFACGFCASGIGGFKRHLTTSEILNQILYVQRRIKDRGISHVVFMGVGEPLDNYDNVIKSVRIINSPEGLGIAARRITISTCGLVPRIRQLAEENLQFELSVSLHGYDEVSRCMLMPVSKKHALGELMAACRDYIKRTNRQITFEYILIKGLTCSEEAARSLGLLVKGMLCKLNLIPYNPVSEFDFLAPTKLDVLSFKTLLSAQGVHATVRQPRGKDIAAACGQLRRGKGN